MTQFESLIQQYCPNGVKWVKLGEVCRVITAPKKLDKKQYQSTGLYPIVDQGQKFIVAYTDDVSAIVAKDSYVIFGDHTREIKYVDFEFAQGADGVKILKANNGLIPRYLYFAMTNMQITSRGYNRHWTIVQDMEIPLPPLPIQEKIVEILDKFSTLSAELEAELEGRRKQYEYYRTRLLSFDSDSDTVVWKTLGEVCYYSKDRIEASYIDSSNYIGVENILQNRLGKCEATSYPKEGSFVKYKANDVLIGNIRPYLKKIWLADRTGGTNGDVLCLSISESYKKQIEPRYLYQLLCSDTFFNYDNQYAKGAKMPRGDKDAVLKYPIPIPPLAEQERIVAILDKFEALVTDLSQGLPAEIQKVQQQYEYYRNQLLSF